MSRPGAALLNVGPPRSGSRENPSPDRPSGFLRTWSGQWLNLSETVILDMTSGNSRALAAGDLLIDTNTANSDNLAVGDTVPVKFALTGPTTMRIGGVFQPNALAEKYVVSDAVFLRHFKNPLPGAVLLKTDGSPGVQQKVEKALGRTPTAGPVQSPV